jgi:exopolysaccharide biosynthesis protein
MNKSLATLILSLLFITNFAVSQTIAQKGRSLTYEQLQLDSLYNSRQIISMLKIPLTDIKNYTIQLVYSQSELKKTSTFATEAKAMAAINAGFFNIKEGGSATYLEIDDSVVSYTGGAHRQHPLNDSLINGAVVFTKLNQLKFEYRKSDSLYQVSAAEAAVLATGPVLLMQGEKVVLANKSFVTKRHPRTCLCLTEKELLLITVDGRSEVAAGMSLPELQAFLQTSGCTDAINLDGGGSTTMWLQGKGIVNHPSDKTGERKVANAIIIKEKIN